MITNITDDDPANHFVVDPDEFDANGLTEDGVYLIEILLNGEPVFSSEVEIRAQIDTTPPTGLDIVGLQPAYEVGDVVDVQCAAVDDVSGLDTCTISPPVSTAAAGTFIAQVTATDVAGNTATADFEYTVEEPALPCDDAGDAKLVVGDIVGCSAEVARARKVLITLEMAVPVRDGPQYRLSLSDAPNDSGAQVKYQDGKESGKALTSVITEGRFITFVVDPGKVGITSGETLYWSASTQDGAKGQQSAGFLDFAPDVGVTPDYVPFAVPLP